MARLLVVDDDPHVRQLVPKLAYQSVGRALEVVVAADLGEALAILAASPVDAVLSDYFMPEVDGPELVRRLRRIHPGLRAVVMTGDAEHVGEELSGLAVPVRDKAELPAVVEEAAQLALERM